MESNTPIERYKVIEDSRLTSNMHKRLHGKGNHQQEVKDVKIEKAKKNNLVMCSISHLFKGECVRYVAHAFKYWRQTLYQMGLY